MIKPAPYAADVRAKGWRFELDHERIRQSDTWALAPPEMRPWLLMLWMTAWEQSPCGSLPAADELVAARIGMPIKTFAKHRSCLMRGWWPADDGRLYHDTLVERVIEMMGAKDKERARKAAYRARLDAEKTAASHGSPHLSHGTTTGQPRDSHGSDPGRDDTGTGTGTYSEPIGSGGKPPLTPDEIIFGYGVPLLTAASVEEKHARSFLGKLRKVHGDKALIDGLRECIKAKPLQPLEWLAKALPPHPIEEKADPDSRSAVEAEAKAKGIRPFDHMEQWSAYLARVRGTQPPPMSLASLSEMAAQRQGAH